MNDKADAAVPKLKITQTANGLVLSWPAQVADFQLEAATSPSASDWVLVDMTPVEGNHARGVSLITNDSNGVFRLRRSFND